MLRKCLLFFLLLSAVLASTACNKTPAPTSSFEVASQGLHTAALDDKGEYVFAASINHGGSLWRTSDSERFYNWNHTENELSTILSADFDSAGNWALTAEAHTLVLWDTSKGSAYRFWTAPGDVLDVALGPNGSSAILGLDDHSAVIFDIRRGGILRTFTHQNRVRSVDLSDDGSIAITGSEDYSAKTWNVRTGKVLFAQQHADDVQLVKLSADGKLALSVSKYDKALVWQSETGEPLGEIPLNAEHLKRGIRFTTARFSHDNRYLLTGRPDQRVELWDIQSMQRIQEWLLPKRDKWKPSSAAVLSVSFTQTEGQYLAVGSNGMVHTLQR